MARSFDPNKAAAGDPFSAIPVGMYIVRVTDLEKKVGKSSGEPYLNLTLTVLAGPLASHPHTVQSPYLNRKIFDILSYSDAAQAKLGKAFIAVDHPQPPRDLDDVAEMRNEVFFGRTAAVVIKHEDFNGEPQAKAATWKPLSPEQRAAFPHQPPGGHIPGPATGAPPTGGTTAGPAIPMDDSDIPFAWASLIPLAGALLAAAHAAMNGLVG